jgi:hypothetical protein
MPSNPGKNVFKAKSIMKPKTKPKSTKQYDKENNLINAQMKQAPKIIGKPRSLLPKPSNKQIITKNIRKGEFQKYISDSKQTDKCIPIKIPGKNM